MDQALIDLKTMPYRNIMQKLSKKAEKDGVIITYMIRLK